MGKLKSEYGKSKHERDGEINDGKACTTMTQGKWIMEKGKFILKLTVQALLMNSKDGNIIMPLKQAPKNVVAIGFLL